MKTWLVTRKVTEMLNVTAETREQAIAIADNTELRMFHAEVTDVDAEETE